MWSIIRIPPLPDLQATRFFFSARNNVFNLHETGNNAYRKESSIAVNLFSLENQIFLKNLLLLLCETLLTIWSKKKEILVIGFQPLD